MSEDPKTVRLPFMVTPTEAQAIDDWRYATKVPTRAEAMRRLIELGLKADDEIDLLNEQIVILRQVALEWAEKAGAPPEIIEQIKSDDPGRASSNPLLRKIAWKDMPEGSLLKRLRNHARGAHHPQQTTPKKPSRGK